MTAKRTLVSVRQARQPMRPTKSNCPLAPPAPTEMLVMANRA